VLTQGATAIKELERAIEMNPYNEMYRMEVGVVWQDLFRTAAREYVEQAGSGADTTALRQQTEQYLTRAAAAYLEAIDYVPYEYDTYVFLANLYNEAAIYLDSTYAQKAAEAAQKGVAVEEYGPAIRLQLAIAYLTLGQVDDAITELEFAAALDTNYTQVYTMLGDAYRRAGRFEEGRTAYQHVLTSDPANTDALSGLAALEASEAAQTAAP